MKSQTKLLALSLLVASFASVPVMAEQAQIGKSEFKSHCAGCHGLDGKGNGPFVEFLTKKPSSLTALARDNQGVFPFQQVYDVIDGTSQIGVHGKRHGVYKFYSYRSFQKLDFCNQNSMPEK